MVVNASPWVYRIGMKMIDFRNSPMERDLLRVGAIFTWFAGLLVVTSLLMTNSALAQAKYLSLIHI